MIRSCKYCLSQTHLCPRCEGPVLVRRITEFVHGSVLSTSLILCTNLNCQNYGTFKQQTIEAVEVYICDECQKRESAVNE